MKMIHQLFAEAVQGKKKVYLYRVHDQASTVTGMLVPFTTENGTSISKDADSTATKDGSIRTPGTTEIEISGSSIIAVETGILETLKDAMKNDKLLDIWEANLSRPGTAENTFKGTYYQGYLTAFDETSSADDFAMVDLTFGINGSGVDGDVTVSVQQQEEAQYDFVDTTIQSTQGGGA